MDQKIIKIVEADAWEGIADCQQCSLRNSVLFAGLTEDDFTRLHRPVEQFVLHPGEQLYAAGESGSSMFTIRSGLIKLVQYLPDGTQRIVRLLKTTDVVGLEILLDERYQHDAIALQPTELCRYPAKAVNELSIENPRLHHDLMARWQKALTDADAWVTELSTGSAKQRVARLLLRLVRDEDSSECMLFGREDMGAMLGITTETASRTIADFKRKGLIVETSTNRFICDVPNLERLLES